MEIMVCLVVMSVVIIGASGLLLQSGRLARNSAQMAEASVLASELAAILRARMRIGTNAVWPAWARQLDFQLAQGMSRGSFLDCRAQDCSAEQVLQFELDDWAARATIQLRAGRLVLCRDLKPWNETASRFDWACQGSPDAPLLLKLGWQPLNEKPAAVDPLLVMTIE